MTMRILASASALAAVLGAASVGAAETEPDETDETDVVIEVGSQLRWLGDSSAATIAPGVMFGPRITGAYELLGVPGPGGRTLDISVVARIAGGDSTGQVFQTLDTRITQLELGGGARIDMPLWRWIGVEAQLVAGAARTSVVIGDSMSPTPVDDAGWGFIGTASAGLTVSGRARDRYLYGVGIDVGYTVTSAVGIRAEPSNRPEEELSMPTVYEALGGVDTGGIVGSVTLRGGF
jgi:hypothetical protein